ncbi:MAG: hypothetical protein AAFR87_23360 [Bacteroidota bacterium]
MKIKFLTSRKFFLNEEANLRIKADESLEKDLLLWVMAPYFD